VKVKNKYEPLISKYVAKN